MRILLIIVGLLVIVGFLLHGLWTIRKVNPKNKISRKKNKPHVRGSEEKNSESSFDEYGVGSVRVVSQSAPQKMHKKRVQAEIRKQETPSVHQAGGKNKAASRREPSVSFEQMTLDFGDEVQPQVGEPELTERTEPSTSTTSVSVTQQTKATDKTVARAVEEADSEAAGEVTKQATSTTLEDETDRVKKEVEQDSTTVTEEEPEIIALYVSGDIQGPILLQTLTELGFKYGDMNIFHRHESPSGKGPSLFCVANMFNPGSFDLDDMDSFNTRGLALFMVLPVAGDAHQVFSMMHNAAIKISEAMPRAALLDDQRNPLTKQAVQHTYQRIREFERQQQIKAKQTPKTDEP